MFRRFIHYLDWLFHCIGVLCTGLEKGMMWLLEFGVMESLDSSGLFYFSLEDSLIIS